MNRNVYLGAGWVAVVAVVAAGWWGCGTQLPVNAGQFVSHDFRFEISVPADLVQAGWMIIRADQAAVTHIYIPPDSSQFEPVAVVAPPGYSFPTFAPFFVDIFRIKNPSITAAELAELRVGQVGETLKYRHPTVIHGILTEELIHGREDDLTYEILIVGRGLGYSINTRGAPDTSATAQQFLVSSGAFRDIAATFRFLD